MLNMKELYSRDTWWSRTTSGTLNYHHIRLSLIPGCLKSWPCSTKSGNIVMKMFQTRKKFKWI